MSLVNAAHGRSDDTSAVHPTGERPHGDRRSLRRVVGAYAALAKPRVIELLLVTTIPAMLLAARGVPSLWLIAATLVGGSMAAGIVQGPRQVQAAGMTLIGRLGQRPGNDRPVVLR